MATARDLPDVFKNASVASTVVDAVSEFIKGRPKSGILLLAAAVVSTRFSGFGTAVSVLLRVYRRLR